MTRACWGGRAGAFGIAVAIAVGTVAFGTVAPGCGAGLFVIDILPASSAVAQAEQAGAAEWAPYEYWTAHEYLQKAAEENNEGNYQDAIRFAQRAKQMARAALAQTLERRRADTEATLAREREARSSGDTAGGEAPVGGAQP